MSDTAGSPAYLGSCLCGGVRYAIHAEIQAVTHCHCQMCRKAHGAAFATYVSVPAVAHAFTEGGSLLRSYRSSPDVTRTFCAGCGSPLAWQRHVGEFSAWLSFPLGTLDSAYLPRTQKHVHADAKAPWHVIGDDGPRRP